MVTAPKINLLKAKKIVFDKSTVLRRKVIFWSGVVLAGYLALLIGVVSVDLIFTNQIDILDEAIASSSRRMAAKQMTEKAYLSLIARLKSAEALLNARLEVVGMWNSLLNTYSKPVAVTGFSLKDKELDVELSSPHVVASTQAIDKLASSMETLGADSSKINISRSEDAAYKLNITYMLKKKVGGL